MKMTNTITSKQKGKEQNENIDDLINEQFEDEGDEFQDYEDMMERE